MYLEAKLERNEIFMETHTLNKKKVFITIAIFILIIATIVGIIMYNSYEKAPQNVTIKSTDGKFSISIPKNINYRINSDTNNQFSIDLYSTEDEMFLYASSIEKLRELDLYEVAKDDKDNYLSNKENIRDDSGIQNISINNYKACEYSFVYYDSSYGKDFYCNTVWIETSNYIYILNFEVVNDNVNKYKNIFANIKNSFVEL